MYMRLGDARGKGGRKKDKGVHVVYSERRYNCRTKIEYIVKMYKITLTFTDPYLGHSYGGSRTLVTGLSLRDAQIWLLDKYNELLSDYIGFAPNWGLAVVHSRKHLDCANRTFTDGTRSLDYDSRLYAIELEDK